MDEQLVKTLLKRAQGYKYNEIVSEYAVDENGRTVLTKKKIVSKYCPPDTGALKEYLSLNAKADVEGMSDEELEAEKERLLASLLKESKDETVPKKSAAKNTAAKGKSAKSATSKKAPTKKATTNKEKNTNKKPSDTLE